MLVKENVNSNKIIKAINKANSSQLFWILSFTALTAIAAQITVPVKPVPFTLQTMMVVLAGAFLGAKNGAYSQILYLFLGCIGLPVFAQIPDPAIGFARLIGPTGGYLLAFPIAAFITGYFVEKNKKYLSVIISMFAGSVLILFIGSFYFGSIYLHNIKEALISGAVVFSVWEVVKVFAAASIYFGISKRFSKLHQ
jgi:biotin transport system substrate-specific component